MDVMKVWHAWIDSDVVDPNTKEELERLASDEEEIRDRFYRDLSFGTGGLRGVLGAGTNRMNEYTVAKASQGLANYVIKHYDIAERNIAISYDSRKMSFEFAQIASGVFAANGIKVFIYSKLMPTPCLSFAVRALKCAAGVMITASHNPAKYNGYKVYGADGCQITTVAADEIYREIESSDIFRDVKRQSFEAGLASGSISFIPQSVYTDFIEEVKKQSVLFGDKIDRNVSIVYTPLNGTGLKPVMRALTEEGFTNVVIVHEQEKPDGNFPTCPYPNPEIKEAMALGIQYARENHADLLLATDPDCDRVGIAVRDNTDGEMKLLTGNETGILLLDYLCAQRIKHGRMPHDPVIVKTIVTTDMAEAIATAYGVRTINVLTGFKFIGEQIGRLERQGNAESYLFGFEESYGCLSGTYVRDKDAVNGALLICEMFAFYKTRGIGLLEKLNELYERYGYYLNTLYSYDFEGEAGFETMKKLMCAFRTGTAAFGDKKVVTRLDYQNRLSGLPKSDVLKFILEDGCTVVVRPSGTEPKLKVYISVRASSRLAAMEEEGRLKAYVDARISLQGRH